ncbi:hypothetical protein WJX72_010410 [[Myrmecia] bisecta]|uniref:Uncharacterized protein n=1 Tax=[Myrmecia] bisecta TaxID=41462 RepID=A0AAW1R9F0_9CHLO
MSNAAPFGSAEDAVSVGDESALSAAEPPGSLPSSPGLYRANSVVSHTAIPGVIHQDAWPAFASTPASTYGQGGAQLARRHRAASPQGSHAGEQTSAVLQHSSKRPRPHSDHSRADASPATHPTQQPSSLPSSVQGQAHQPHQALNPAHAVLASKRRRHGVDAAGSGQPGGSLDSPSLVAHMHAASIVEGIAAVADLQQPESSTLVPGTREVSAQPATPTAQRQLQLRVARSVGQPDCPQAAASVHATVLLDEDILSDVDTDLSSMRQDASRQATRACSHDDFPDPQGSVHRSCQLSEQAAHEAGSLRMAARPQGSSRPIISGSGGPLDSCGGRVSAAAPSSVTGSGTVDMTSQGGNATGSADGCAAQQPTTSTGTSSKGHLLDQSAGLAAASSLAPPLLGLPVSAITAAESLLGSFDSRMDARLLPAAGILAAHIAAAASAAAAAASANTSTLLPGSLTQAVAGGSAGSAGGMRHTLSGACPRAGAAGPPRPDRQELIQQRGMHPAMTVVTAAGRMSTRTGSWAGNPIPRHSSGSVLPNAGSSYEGAPEDAQGSRREEAGDSQEDSQHSGSVGPAGDCAEGNQDNGYEEEESRHGSADWDQQQRSGTVANGRPSDSSKAVTSPPIAAGMRRRDVNKRKRSPHCGGLRGGPPSS